MSIIKNMNPVIPVLGLMVFAMIFYASPAHAELVYHGKNIVESPAEFTGTVFHFMIKNDKATVVSFGQKGMEVMRMDIVPSKTCEQEKTLCFDGTVTNVRNPQIHQVGDKVSFILDFANKKQIGIAKSGPMSGMSVVMKIERMSAQTDAPYTISVSREGGFAALPQKVFSFDSSSGILSVTNGESTNDITLDENAIQEIDQAFQQGRILKMTHEQYTPHPGAADYFSYRLILDQGVFHKEITWTDASDAPQSLSELSQALMAADQVPAKPTGGLSTIDVYITNIAREFVSQSPTFAFDGMEDTLEFGPVSTMESNPIQYGIDASFTSSHGGFGDRTDQMVTEALTPHKMSIIISENEVISAITDDTWDELNNQYVLKAPN